MGLWMNAGPVGGRRPSLVSPEPDAFPPTSPGKVTRCDIRTETSPSPVYAITAATAVRGHHHQPLLFDNSDKAARRRKWWWERSSGEPYSFLMTASVKCVDVRVRTL